jgi:hypothetical protein
LTRNQAICDNYFRIKGNGNKMAHCNDCGSKVFWQRGRKTGKLYLTNTESGRTDFHSKTCTAIGRGIENAQNAAPVASPYQVRTVANINAPGAKQTKQVIGVKRDVSPAQAADLFRKMLAGEQVQIPAPVKVAHVAEPIIEIAPLEIDHSFDILNKVAELQTYNFKRNDVVSITAGLHTGRLGRIVSLHGDYAAYVDIQGKICYKPIDALELHESAPEPVVTTKKVIPVSDDVLAQLYVIANSGNDSERKEAAEKLAAMFAKSTETLTVTETPLPGCVKPSSLSLESLWYQLAAEASA